jgi:hypothetical protein
LILLAAPADHFTHRSWWERKAFFNLIYKIGEVDESADSPGKIGIPKFVRNKEIVQSGESHIPRHDLPDCQIQGGHGHLEFLQNFKLFWGSIFSERRQLS